MFAQGMNKSMNTIQACDFFDFFSTYKKDTIMYSNIYWQLMSSDSYSRAIIKMPTKHHFSERCTSKTVTCSDFFYNNEGHVGFRLYIKYNFGSSSSTFCRFVIFNSSKRNTKNAFMLYSWHDKESYKEKYNLQTCECIELGALPDKIDFSEFEVEKVISPGDKMLVAFTQEGKILVIKPKIIPHTLHKFDGGYDCNMKYP